MKGKVFSKLFTTALITIPIVLTPILIFKNDSSELKHPGYGNLLTTTEVYDGVDINPDSSSMLDSEYDIFNSDEDVYKYYNVWNVSESETDSSFGNGKTYTYEVDLSQFLEPKETNTWVSEVTFDTNERFDFYRTLQLTDEGSSGRFWSSAGITNEDTVEGVEGSYKNWGSMDYEQKNLQAPHVGAGLNIPNGIDCISIKPGENKTLVNLEYSENGLPLQFDDSIEGDGFVNEISLQVTTSLSYDSVLTINLIFGDGDPLTTVAKGFNPTLNEMFAVHLPRIKVEQMSNSLPSGVTGNVGNEIYETKTVDIDSDKIHLNFIPDDVQFSSNAMMKDEAEYIFKDDSSTGTYTEFINDYYKPNIDESHYNNVTGDYEIAFEKQSMGKEMGREVVGVYHNYTYQGQLTYSREYSYPGEKFDLGKMFDADYTEEDFINETKDSLYNLNLPLYGIHDGIFIDATYNDLEYAIRNYVDYENVPLSDAVDIKFYDSSMNEIEDELEDQTMLESGEINLRLVSTTKNEDIFGQTEIISFRVPYLDQFSVNFKNDYSISHYKSYYDIVSEGNHVFNLYTNVDADVQYTSSDYSFVNTDGNFTSSEMNPYIYHFETDLDNNGSKYGHKNPTITSHFNSEGVDYELNIINNSEPAFTLENFQNNITFADADTGEIIERDFTKKISDTNPMSLMDVIVVDTIDDEDVVINNFDAESIKQNNHIIYDVAWDTNNSRFSLVVWNGNHTTQVNSIVLSKREWVGGNNWFFDTDLSKEMLQSAYERGAIDSIDPSIELNIDSKTIAGDYEIFNDEVYVQEYIDGYMWMMEDALNSLLLDYGIVSGVTNTADFREILTMIWNDEAWPFKYALDEEGNIINSDEWDYDLIKLNGIDVTGVEDKIINNGDTVQISIKHNRTINPEQEFYGEGILEVQLDI